MLETPASLVPLQAVSVVLHMRTEKAGVGDPASVTSLHLKVAILNPAFFISGTARTPNFQTRHPTVQPLNQTV